MSTDEIMDAIKQMASTQGYYARLLRSIQQMEPGARVEYTSKLESQKFSGLADLVLYLER